MLSGYLVDLSGPNMTIYGAVQGQNVCINTLVPTLWLVRQPKMPEVMINIVKVLKAFHNAVLSLEVNVSRPLQPRFSAFRQNSIVYTKCIQPHVFQGTLEGTNVVMLFCDTYGAAVHNTLHRNKLAPKLHLHEKFGRFEAVVMDYVEGVPIHQYVNETTKEAISGQCKKILECLKNEGYVCGDLRNVNILVNKECEVNVIDFEWAGRAGDVKYPYFLNHVHLEWPNSASDGKPILPEHEKHWWSMYIL